MFKRHAAPLRSGLRSLKFGSRLSMMEPSVMAAARTPKPPLSSRAVRITKLVAICNCCAVEAAYSLGTTTLWCHALICLERLESVESSTLQIQWSYDPSVPFTPPTFWWYLWHSPLSSTMIQSVKKWIYHNLSWICLQSVKNLSKLRAPLVFCIQGATKKRPPTSKNTAASVTSAPDGRPGICSCPRDSASWRWLQYGAMSIGKVGNHKMEKQCEDEDSLICGASSHLLVFQFCRKMYVLVILIWWHIMAFVTSATTGWRRAICYPLATSSPTVALRPAFNLDAMPRANSWTVSWSKVCVVGRRVSQGRHFPGKALCTHGHWNKNLS